MIFRPFYLSCLAHASYLLGDEETRTAVVIDPQRDVDVYLEEAARLGLKIRHVMLTHFHADFVSGHLELRERCGAQIHLGARASASYVFSRLVEGRRLDIGSLGLAALETPGHTPESVVILAYDLKKDRERPWAAFTGDTLFIGDVGRPDLAVGGGETAEALAGKLYDSLHGKILKLPDETLVYPAHGAGSLCGKALSDERVSTIGEQKRFNTALKAADKDSFVRLVCADQPEAPAYFAHDAEMNREEHATLEAAVAKALSPLSPDALAGLRAQGAQVVDTRDPAEFAEAHVPRAVNVGLDGKFASWAGSVLERGRPLLLVAPPGREREAATRLARVGLDRVEGTLAGGMESLHQRPELVSRAPRLSAAELAEKLSARRPPAVIDVRTDGERAEGFIPGSVHLPLSQWPRRMSEIPQGPVVVYCAGGYRSSIAASLLRAAGRSEVTDLIGGFAAWREEGRPVAAA